MRMKGFSMLAQAVGARRIASLALLACGGCLFNRQPALQLAFVEIPPAVRSAFIANYPNASIRSITCEADGGQYYYMIVYEDSHNNRHTVLLNEAGDEVNRFE
jgi:hypothetical protein